MGGGASTLQEEVDEIVTATFLLGRAIRDMSFPGTTYSNSTPREFLFEFLFMGCLLNIRSLTQLRHKWSVWLICAVPTFYNMCNSRLCKYYNVRCVLPTCLWLCVCDSLNERGNFRHVPLARLPPPRGAAPRIEQTEGVLFSIRRWRRHGPIRYSHGWISTQPGINIHGR